MCKDLIYGLFVVFEGKQCLWQSLHTYILHTYVLHACHACIHRYIHTYLPTYLRTYIHTYIHTYIRTHTHMHTYIHACMHTCTCKHCTLGHGHFDNLYHVILHHDVLKMLCLQVHANVPRPSTSYASMSQTHLAAVQVP